MKRSEINNIIDVAIAFSKEMNFLLPPFAHMSPEQIKTLKKNPEYAEIFENKLGWDITDFGSGNFAKIGLTMLTIRNGNYADKKYVKPYAEKLMVVEEGQITPYHYHSFKVEDIINRGGGILVVKLYNSRSKTECADTDVTILKDGRKYTVKAGDEVMVLSGESITIETGVFHSFWGKKGTGRILVGEVSSVNDDYTDNCFLKKVGRFPQIIEDEPTRHILYSEYDTI